MYRLDNVHDLPITIPLYASLVLIHLSELTTFDTSFLKSWSRSYEHAFENGHARNTAVFMLLYAVGFRISNHHVLSFGDTAATFV